MKGMGMTSASANLRLPGTSQDGHKQTQEQDARQAGFEPQIGSYPVHFMEIDAVPS
jgi:hypothetical protein